jgi:hypothetical protein
MNERRIQHKANSLMTQFDIKRHAHRFCENTMHVVYYADSYVHVCHTDEVLINGAQEVLSTVEVHGANISESQRATLRERLMTILKGKT